MAQKSARPGNRLRHEKSPYLLQHSSNPVDWYPWGDEAFEKARRENKPIFLSIGYSTCHWCHVMKRESFEDPRVASLMNDAFISVKVDREERPDIDKLYMTVCNMLTGSGGWPLTIIMTPDKKPFFAATYIPKASRFGRTGMTSLIPAVQEAWAQRKHEVLSSAAQITALLQTHSADASREDLTQTALSNAYEELARRFDSRFGGFGTAPKFPTPHNLLFLLRYWKRSGDPTALEMVQRTLCAMRQGGIYDHIGFGFHRYSTDERWLVPHFEKMLYDQALLTMAYIEAFQATGAETFAHTAREIITYVLRDMTSREGGFYSAEDADSEGEEGKFYTWTREEVEALIPREEAIPFMTVFHVSKGGNFRDEVTGRQAATNILHRSGTRSGLAAEFNLPEAKLCAMLEAARKRLFAARNNRVHPAKDDKILTDWNGLMIAALARAAQVFDDPTYSRAAQNAADFIMGRMRLPNGRLLHRYRAQEAAVPASLDDYAFFIWGLIELYEATFNSQHLAAALALNRDLLAHFWDHNGGGGFFFSPDDGEALLLRQKEPYDGALPSGNSVAMHNLLRIARMTGDVDYEDKAAQIGKVFSSAVMQHPSAAAHLLTALDFALGPSFEVVIAGSLEQAETKDLLKTLRTPFLPHKVVLHRPENGDRLLSGIAPFAVQMTPINGKPAAYVCSNFACASPTTDASEMLRLLKGESTAYAR